MSNGKTIRISKETYEKLANQGNLQDSFDSVISRLIDKQKVILDRQNINGEFNK
jgi:predicted CopG family antitoxin